MGEILVTLLIFISVNILDIVLDLIEKFSVSNGFGRNCKIYEVDINSSPHIDNMEKDTLILGEGPIQRLDDKNLTTEKIY